MTAAGNDVNEAIGDERDNIPFLTAARSIFLGWEMLRPLYVLLLAGLCMGLFLIAPHDADAIQFWRTCGFGGIIANLCYFAGPISEPYVAWLGWRHHIWVRMVLFCLGLLFTISLAIGAHANNLMPGVD